MRTQSKTILLSICAAWFTLGYSNKATAEGFSEAARSSHLAFQEPRELSEEDIDKELLEALGGIEGEDLAEPGESTTSKDPVLRIGEWMRRASLLILEGNKPGEAPELQKKIIADIDLLIAQQQKKKNKKSGKKGGQSKQKQKKRSNPKPSNCPPGKKPKPSDKPAKDSIERFGSSNVKEVAKTAREALLKDVWGRLPRRAREQMLDSPFDQFLPEFELEIEQYFRRLAEEPGPDQSN